jgi:anhydro-N-acetylmuramic acid kinase
VRSTLQIAEPSVIAERTGITTVADFRPRDVAAGGQGAPLVPYADHVLFADGRRSRAVQNIGGIANVTYLPAGGGIGDILAFDTGPGNMIIDRVVCRATAGRRTYDKDGRMAAGGTVQPDLLARLMRHPYLRRRPPKTTGREEFGTQFTDSLYDGATRRFAPKDVAATATMFTAASIADAYARFLPGPVDEVILCGGGARNATLVDMLRRELRRRLPRAPAVRLMDELGLNADAKEAVSFAVLAAATIRGQAGNVPSATGASRPAVLGKIVPGR